MDNKIIKEVLADIWRNFRVPLVLALGFLVALIWSNAVDPFDYPWQFWMMTIICTAVYPACIVYGIIKYLRMKKGSKE